MIKKILYLLTATAVTATCMAQQPLTPEKLWQIGRVGAIGLTKDQQYMLYSVNQPNVAENKGVNTIYAVNIATGQVIQPGNEYSNMITDPQLSPDGKYRISAKDVKLVNVEGKEFYPDLPKSNVKIYDQLNYRHWDTWEDGAYSHVFLTTVADNTTKDIMPGEKYDCPQKPFGSEEDYIFSPDSKKIIYVAKKKYGTAYAVSTNTDLYEYTIATGATRNLTENNKGYDVNPAFSKNGTLAWLQMKRDGFEADKQDIIIMLNNMPVNLTGANDAIHVNTFKWSNDGKKIYFTAPQDGTNTLYEIIVPATAQQKPVIKKLAQGNYDINDIVGEAEGKLFVIRTDMNRATEIYTVNTANGQLTALTHVNDDFYKDIATSKVEKRFVKTTDNKNMLVWVIYPPGFDPAKKYPTLLYCQGGPQSPLTQFYSFRWNFQLMAANGYIVVAPCRRGMPGFGTQWNEDISKAHGGQAINDYLSAIDAVSKESYVDKNRLGCIGASYGGYSVFMLAGVHKNRFKTFISHDGIFDMRSMYGSTEELFFVDWDYGGPYWDKTNKAAQQSYEKYSPSNYVQNWNTPMLIFQGEKDYRVPPEQAFQAFQVLQLKGIKSKLVYLPEENHWVTRAQNALVWQRQFYEWLKETL